MRNLIIALAIVLVFPLVAQASPFLVCDPQAEVVEYEVRIMENDVVVMGGIVPAEADTTLRFDLETIPNGTYIARVRAAATGPNLWGWSEWAESFGFVVYRCNPPTGVVIVP